MSCRCVLLATLPCLLILCIFICLFIISPPAQGKQNLAVAACYTLMNVNYVNLRSELWLCQIGTSLWLLKLQGFPILPGKATHALTLMLHLNSYVSTFDTVEQQTKKNIPTWPGKLPHSDRVVLVTGAAGFIGFNVALVLRERWPRAVVVGLDSFSNYYDVQLKKVGMHRPPVCVCVCVRVCACVRGFRL